MISRGKKNKATKYVLLSQSTNSNLVEETKRLRDAPLLQIQNPVGAQLRIKQAQKMKFLARNEISQGFA